MARLHDATPAPEQSVLDRLLDDEPELRHNEPPRDFRAGLDALRRNVLRDVQWVLNARAGEIFGEEDRDRLPKDGPERVLMQSVLRFGLRDFSTLDLRNDTQREALRRRILFALAAFEPRLVNVSVTIQSAAGDEGRTRFHVEARLHCDPEPQAIGFDATVMWRNRKVEVV
ncbi:MAG: type VI secretion system baseplate subunit TssE [Planctomycetes bacterium]|nr:type VI secretion system baseplate subunit TssE [Planctomycetota bacterium]